MAAVTIEHIEITPGLSGGKPHIVGHRITVQDVFIWHERLGLEPDEIATQYDLSLSEVYGALAYYHDHRNEIESSLQANDAFVTELRRNSPSKVAEKLRG